MKRQQSIREAKIIEVQKKKRSELKGIKRKKGKGKYMRRRIHRRRGFIGGWKVRWKDREIERLIDWLINWLIEDTGDWSVDWLISRSCQISRWRDPEQRKKRKSEGRSGLLGLRICGWGNRIVCGSEAELVGLGSCHSLPNGWCRADAGAACVGYTNMYL